MPRKRSKARKPRRTQKAAPSRNDLNAASRAQLGADPERRPVRPPQDDASIEDPLQDWPDNER